MSASSLLYLFFLFVTFHSTRPDHVTLLDTRIATAELNWKTWSNQEERDGWLEETIYSEEQKVNHRVFSICDVGHTDVENWLLVPAVYPSSEVSRIQIEIGYSIAKCDKLVESSKRQIATCRETMNLFALRTQEQLGQNWFNDTRWKYLDTLVAKSERETGAKYVITASYPVVNPSASTRIHFALKNTGACAAILYVKVYYNNFYPETSYAFWMWLVICFASTFILCCAFLVISRYFFFNRKKSSDMDYLNNFKRANLPLIPTYHTVQQNPLTMGITLTSNRYKPYIDPTTYEHPGMPEFSNEINVECVTVTRVIGAGEFGEVCSGRLITEDIYGQQHEHVVAVKTLLPGSSAKAKSDFLMEALIMGQFEHENVIRLLGVVTKTEPVMILTEYMINGSLNSFLKANDNKIETFQLVHILHGIACGMKYLTDKGYVHRDLAARNVLVDDRLICKIADFGLSRGLTDSLGEQEYTTQNSEKIPIRWTAPEAIAHSKYTAASDVWSYGVVMWEVFSYGDRPYGNWTNHKVIDEVRTGYRLAPPQNTPPRLGELMSKCWNMERHSRPTFGEVVAELNSYINDFLWRPSPTRFINPPYSSGR